MPKILIAECMQEISSFNPLPSDYENFQYRARRRAVAPARPEHRDRRRPLGVRGRGRTSTLVPTYRRAGRQRRAALGGGLGAALRRDPGRGRGRISPASTASTCRCMARWGPTASSTRRAICWPRSARMAGADMPIVISLDLHGILTDRMLRRSTGSRSTTPIRMSISPIPGSAPRSCCCDCSTAASSR